MGGSSGGNPFENVSWSTPFGGSALGQAGGSVQNAIGNATQGVSLNKPFGDSAASELVGGGGGINSIFNGVSMTNPMGTDSTLAQATGHAQNAPLTSTGVDKSTGEQGTYNPNAPPGAGAGLPSFPSATAPAAPAPTTAPSIANRGGTMPRYGNSANEDAFRRSYIGSLKPNYGFTFQGQQGNPFKAVTTPSKAV